jgi:hypothetical protein
MRPSRSAGTCTWMWHSGLPRRVGFAAQAEQFLLLQIEQRRDDGGGLFLAHLHPRCGITAEPSVRRSGNRRIRRGISRQVRPGGRMPGQGSRRTAGLLREHWDHLRTTNPIESVFATVRHRTVRTKGSLSPTTARLMVFKPIIAASRTWRRLKATNQLPKVIAGVQIQRRHRGHPSAGKPRSPDHLVTQNPAQLR